MEVQLRTIKFLWIGGSIPDIIIKITLYTSSNVDFALNSFEIVMVIKSQS